jgi:hypothetical protein
VQGGGLLPIGGVDIYLQQKDRTAIPRIGP